MKTKKSKTQKNCLLMFSFALSEGCEVGQWSEWGTCSRNNKTCGFKWGLETRTRQIVKKPAKDTIPCPTIAESRRCKMAMRHCPGGKRSPCHKNLYELSLSEILFLTWKKSYFILAGGEILSLLCQPQLKSIFGPNLCSKTPGRCSAWEWSVSQETETVFFLVWCWGFFKEVPCVRTITGCSLSFSMKVIVMVE